MKKKIIVVGAGLSGLCASISALEKGFDVELYEKNPSLGGLCFNFNRSNHYIDGTIHWLTGTKDGTFVNSLWRKLGIIKNDEDIIKIDSLISYKDKFHLYRDQNKAKEEWLKNAPEDEDEIISFFDMVDKYIKLNMSSFNKPYELIQGDSILDMVKTKYPKMYEFLNTLRISRDEYSKRFKNKDLSFFIKNAQVSYNDLYCLLFVYSKFTQGDTDLIKGGSKYVVETLKNKILDLGGKIFVSTSVDEILVDNNKVIGIRTNNKNIYSDYVICATDSIYALKNLLKNKYHIPLLEKMNEDNKNYPLPSAYQITYLLNNKLEGLFDVSNLIKLDEIKIGKNIYDNGILRTYFYDKASFSNDNKTVIHIFFNQNDEDYKYWKNLTKEEYIKQKEYINTTITNNLIKIYPILANNIEIIDSFTPLTINKYTNATSGAYMSYSITGKNTPYCFNGKIDGLENFVLANQFISMPGGLPNAMIMGLLSVDRLLKN